MCLYYKNNLLDPSELRLLYAAKLLRDTDKLSDHGIKDKSTIMLIQRLHGGWTHPVDSLLTPCHQDGYGSTMPLLSQLQSWLMGADNTIFIDGSDVNASFSGPVTVVMYPLGTWPSTTFLLHESV